MKNIITAIILNMFFANIFFLYSQSRRVSLNECINIALQNHPDIGVSFEDNKKSVAKYQVAKSQNKILVNGEVKTVEYLKADKDPNAVNIPGRDTNFGLFAGVTATYNLIDPKKSNIQEMASISVDLSKMSALKSRATIILDVKNAYYSYVLSRESGSLSEELMNKFRVKLNTAKLLFRNGQRPILDVSKAEVDMAVSILEYEKAKNNVMLMKARLLASMGILNEEIEVLPVAIEELPELKYSLKELYRLAEYNYPDIRIARLTKRIMKINIVVEKSERYPRVDIFGSFGMENKFENSEIKKYDKFQNRFFEGDNWEPTIHAGFQAKMPLLSRGGISGRVDAAIADYRKSEYREKKIKINIRGYVRAYHQALNELAKQADMSELIIENAKKHIVLAQKSYENGIGSQLDMHDAEMSVLRSKLGLLEARYEYMKILARLANIVGLGEEHLCRKQAEKSRQ